MEKKFVKLDNIKKGINIFNLISLSVLFLTCIVFLFANILPTAFLNVFFWVWIGFLAAYLIFLAIIILIYNKELRNTLKSKYNFNRDEINDNIITNFKDCILQEVEFKEDGFIFNGNLVSYSEVNIEFSIYGDNIMMHIYLKELENTNPLLIFIVSKELYFCCKKFNLNIKDLDKEIDLLNMNYGAKIN